MDIVGGSAKVSLWTWLVAMFALVGLRLVLLYKKNCISEGWLYRVSARITAWFLHRLRRLSPRVFHTPAGEREVESAYEATQMLQVNGGVFFQAVQAVLQLLVFLPVLFYISWPLALFLFVVVVPFVAVLQRKLHRLGPAEESLLRARSDFRGDLALSRRLFRQWSSLDERHEISNSLLDSVRHLRDEGLSAAIKKSGLSLLTESVSVLAMVLVLAFCAILMECGYMDAPGLVLFSSAVLLCYKPVKECARVMPQFRAAMSAVQVLLGFEKLETVGNANSVSGATTQGTSLEGVSIRDGNFRYEGASTSVFTGLNLDWPREKPVLVRGKNGVGKSTLLRLLAGLELWNGGKLPNGNVFFVAQDLELPPRKLLMRRLEQLLPDSPEKKAVFAFVEASGAASLLQKQGLSGGERARVALVWALASGAKTVLLDEPFASVALSDREQLLSAYLSAASSLNKWTIIVSHDVLSSEIEVKFKVVLL